MSASHLSPQELATQADRAAQYGRQRFVLRMVDTLTDEVENKEWAECIATVEASGWRVDHFSTTTDRNGRLVGHVLFRYGS